MMDFNKFRIGYAPISDKLIMPGDKMRFCYYANKRNIKFEIANPSKDYDLVVVTERADKSLWSKYRKSNAKIVYDLVDSYLFIPRYNLKGIFRGLAKYISRESHYLELSYWKAIEGMCKRADAVTCGTEEQKEVILKFCKNVHVILDFTNSVVNKVKFEYSSGDVFNLVWVGLPTNLRSLFEIKEVLRQVGKKYKIAVHIITNLKYYKYLDKYWLQDAANIASRLLDNIYLYEWNEKTCSEIITGCDLAFIPISLNNPFATGKPENKLLLFWRMGMPTVVSATPAYSRVMRQSGLSMACQTKGEWLQTLEKYITDQNARSQAGKSGCTFTNNHFSEEKLLAQWDSVFKSVL